MKVGGTFHLTYCSNIHAGESWDQVRAALGTALPIIRRQLAESGRFAIGLRLSAQAAESLESAAALKEFQTFLRDGNYYVLTINGFPYGAFHGERVKERVYLPDWRDDRRLDYTNRLARLLAALADDRSIPRSVSTVPGAFKSDIRPGDEARIADQMLRHAAQLVALRAATQQIVTLAVEPEPACFIETTGDAVAFFERYLFDASRIARVAAEAGVTFGIDDVRRHVGLCFDACHMAVEFEDAALALDRLREAGIQICKVQVSSAIAADRFGPARLTSSFAPFAEDTYLHQVVQRVGGEYTRYVDLPQALAAVPSDSRDRDWRVHFHVPVFLDDLGGLRTTQPFLRDLLEALRQSGDCPYLEVETYTWDVLPPEHRSVDVWTDIARELAWVRSTLRA